MNRILRRMALGLVLIILCSGGGNFAAMADSSLSETTTLKERHHDRARILREQSMSRARSKLGYPDVQQEEQPLSSSVDFHALGIQIQRLGKMIQRLADPAGAGLPGAGSREAFGPEGPTEKSVRVFLEYRLLVGGNPRLKVGTVRDNGKMIRAEVATQDGSIVEIYNVEKSSGIMKPIRK